MALSGQVLSEVYDRVSRSHYYKNKYPGLTPQQRHQYLLAELNKGSQQDHHRYPTAAAAALAGTVSDANVLHQRHRFLCTAADDAQDNPADWGVRLAKRYYARLFKEYAIADLSRYKESKVGIRWRTKAELESGKGTVSGHRDTSTEEQEQHGKQEPGGCSRGGQAVAASVPKQSAQHRDSAAEDPPQQQQHEDRRDSRGDVHEAREQQRKQLQQQQQQNRDVNNWDSKDHGANLSGQREQHKHKHKHKGKSKHKRKHTELTDPMIGIGRMVMELGVNLDGVVLAAVTTRGTVLVRNMV